MFLLFFCLLLGQIHTLVEVTTRLPFGVDEASRTEAEYAQVSLWLLWLPWDIHSLTAPLATTGGYTICPSQVGY